MRFFQKLKYLKIMSEPNWFIDNALVWIEFVNRCEDMFKNQNWDIDSAQSAGIMWEEDRRKDYAKKIMSNYIPSEDIPKAIWIVEKSWTTNAVFTVSVLVAIKLYWLCKWIINYPSTRHIELDWSQQEKHHYWNVCKEWRQVIKILQEMWYE